MAPVISTVDPSIAADATLSKDIIKEKLAPCKLRLFLIFFQVACWLCDKGPYTAVAID
jgi:hypothetical protein